MPWGEATTLSNLAQVHLYQGNWPEAYTCLSRSRLSSPKSVPWNICQNWSATRGELFLKTDELNEALEHTRRSIDLAVQQSNPLEEGMSHRMSGQVHVARPNGNRPKQTCVKACTSSTV